MNKLNYKINQLLLVKHSLKNSAIIVCGLQREVGDFHFKAFLAMISSDLLICAQTISRYSCLVNLKMASNQLPYQHISKISYLQITKYIDDSLTKIIEQLNLLINSLEEIYDYNLMKNLDMYKLKFENYASQSLIWHDIGLTTYANLLSVSSLWRDCSTYKTIKTETLTIKTQRTIDFAIKWLSNDNTLIEYLHSNAYLELTTIDILSDFIFKISNLNQTNLNEIQIEQFIFEKMNLTALQESYMQITADKINHVRSGLKWFKYFATDIDDYDSFYIKLQNQIEPYIPLQQRVPVSKSIREVCGYSSVFIDIQQNLNGVLHEQLTPST